MLSRLRPIFTRYNSNSSTNNHRRNLQYATLTASITTTAALLYYGSSSSIFASTPSYTLAATPTKTTSLNKTQPQPPPQPKQPEPSSTTPPPTTSKPIRIFGGNSNPELANKIATALKCQLGKATVTRFEDGEVNVVVHENVRGQDVYIVQSTCTPVNENLMELMLMISTMRRASARKITAVIPYYGYARQDRKMTARVPISAADVARLLEAMGVDRVIAVDLHCGQIQGFFGPRVPVDNLDGSLVAVKYWGERTSDPLVNPVIVSPDAGGVYRAKKFREQMDKRHGIKAGLAMIIKQRQKAGEIEKMDLVGSVQGSDAIIVDDMIDSAGTLCNAANELKKYGARRVFAFASHGIFSEPASSRISKSALEEVVVTDTIPLRPSCQNHPKIRQESVAGMLADAIRRIHAKQSVSELFDAVNQKNE
jgi:ribose-phosphate pyrophosphokinase